MTVRSAPSALWKSIGADALVSFDDILAMFASLRALTSPIQSDLWQKALPCRQGRSCHPSPANLVRPPFQFRRGTNRPGTRLFQCFALM